MKTNKVLNSVKLDTFEDSIENSLNDTDWISELTPARFSELRSAARTTIDLAKSKKITIRVNQGDLVKLKARAQRKNIPYQTLLGVLVRDFVDGKYSIEL